MPTKKQTQNETQTNAQESQENLNEATNQEATTNSELETTEQAGLNPTTNAEATTNLPPPNAEGGGTETTASDPEAAQSQENATQESSDQPSHTERSEVSQNRDFSLNTQNDEQGEEFITQLEIENADELSTSEDEPSAEEHFARKINEVSQSDEWLKQVKLTLLTVKDCYTNIDSIHNFYKESINTLKVTKHAHEQALNKAHELNASLQGEITSALQTINEILESAESASQEATRQNLLAQEASSNITKQSNIIIAQGQELISKSAIVQKALSEFKKLEMLIAKSQSLKTELDSLILNHKRELENSKEELESEIIEKFNEASENLAAKYNEHKDALDFSFNSTQNGLNTLIGFLTQNLQSSFKRVDYTAGLNYVYPLENKLQITELYNYNQAQENNNQLVLLQKKLMSLEYRRDNERFIYYIIRGHNSRQQFGAGLVWLHKGVMHTKMYPTNSDYQATVPLSSTQRQNNYGVIITDINPFHPLRNSNNSLDHSIASDYFSVALYQDIYGIFDSTKFNFSKANWDEAKSYILENFNFETISTMDKAIEYGIRHKAHYQVHNIHSATQQHTAEYYRNHKQLYQNKLYAGLFSQQAHFELPSNENEAKWTGTSHYKREYTKHTGEREYNALLNEIATTKQKIINLQESQKNGYAKVNKRETSFSLSIESKQLITTGIKLLAAPQNQTNLNLILAKISNTGSKDLTLRAKFALNQSNHNEAGEAYTQAIESLSSENAQILIDTINKLNTKASNNADSQTAESSEGETNAQSQEKEAILTTELMPRGLIVSKYEMIGKLNYDSNTLIANITNNHQSQRVKNELIFALNKNSGIWLLFVSKFYAKPHATPIKAAIEAHANIEMQIIGEQ